LKILLIAPQPFYQERGTPIAVRLLIEALCLAGHTVDLLTYHEGEDIQLEGLVIERIANIPGVRNVPIGFSWKKLVCDFFLSFKLIRMCITNDYQVIHAVEESIYPAVLVKIFSKKYLVYDMDSSMADQLIEKWNALRFVKGGLDAFEKLAVRKSDTVIAVCEDLAIKAEDYKRTRESIFVVEDVALPARETGNVIDNIRLDYNITGHIALYIGNLEHYQGIDLMLEGYAKSTQKEQLTLVIIGGQQDDIDKYRLKASALGISQKVLFLGPRPVDDLGAYLLQADILISPRLKGRNTPMKIYSYMGSGKAILATRIHSHTQVLDDACAALVAPDADEVAKGFDGLVADRKRRAELGKAASILADEKYSYPAFQKKIKDIYSRIH